MGGSSGRFNRTAGSARSLWPREDQLMIIAQSSLEDERVIPFPQRPSPPVGNDVDHEGDRRDDIDDDGPEAA